MIYEIPITSRTSNFRQKTSLDGRDFEFILRWNQRESRWYMDLNDSDGLILASGRKLVADIPLFARESSEDFPPGILVAIDMSDEEGDPGLLDLGDRVRLLYFDEDSLE
jgi:hypothetical protein